MALGAVVNVNGQFGYSTLELPKANPFSTPEAISKPSYYNEVNTRAMRHFLKNFSDVSDEKWYFTPKMTVVIFTLNEINYRVDYDKKGNWIETLRSYGEAKLSSDLRKDIAYSYRDYKIYLVQEIEQPSHATVYVIHLEGNTKLIKLQVCNGIIDEWQKFDKSK